MTTSNIRLSVRTSSDNDSPPTSFRGYNLAQSLRGWFRHALTSASDPQPLLAHLLAFLQNTSFTFHIASNVGATDHPQGDLQLLSLVYNPPAANQLQWTHSSTQPYPDLPETATPLLSPMDADEFSLIFRSKDNELLVWHAYNEFHTDFCAQDTDSPTPTLQFWQQFGASELQIHQSLTNQPPPVIPAYLCETLRFEDSQATFLIGNDELLTTVAPLRLPLTTLLRMFANQHALCALLHTLKSSFEISVAYCPRCPGRQTRECDLRITASGPHGSLFFITSNFTVDSTSPPVSSLVLIHMKNFLSSFFQWQALRHLVLSHGCTLQLAAGRWELSSNGAPEPACYLYWIGSAPGGYVEILSTPPLEYRFGASADPNHTPEILPPPLEGLSALWTPLQEHLQQLQQAQFQC